MKSIFTIVLICKLFVSGLSLVPRHGLAYSAEHQPVRSTSYTFTLIDVEMWGVLGINDKSDVLAERQLVQFASPAPLIIKKNSKETAAFECPGTTNDTDGEGLNNRGEIVGHCGHQPGFTVVGFVANPKSGSATFVSFPGARATWAFGINDLDQVVGYYENPIMGPICCFLPPRHIHGFVWDKMSGKYKTIDHPFSVETGWPTILTRINNKGQIIGYHYDERYVSFGTYYFIYDNETFTPVRHPQAWDDSSTYVYGFNNFSQIFGAYSGPGCSRCLFFWDGVEYFDVKLPLPNNAPYPKDMSVWPASAFNFAGLNDSGQFVGSYFRILEWGPDPLHPGEFGPTKTEIGNFTATPQKVKTPGKGKKEPVN